MTFISTGETATTYHFKTLVPSVAAGAIIGKGGETIASLQKDAGARVKMSKSHDFYPGKPKADSISETLWCDRKRVGLNF